MSYFSNMLERILGNKQNAKQTKSLKSRSPQLETLEDRMLLSVTAGDLSHPAVVAPVPDDQTDDALVVLPTSAKTIQVGSEKDLLSAVTEAGIGDTIQLTTDIDLKGNESTVNVPSGKEITLDLNGYSLKVNPTASAARYSAITNAGTLTITDSSSADPDKQGSIIGKKGTQVGNMYTYGGGIYNTGTLTIDGGKITSWVTDKKDFPNYGGGIYNSGKDAKITINGGTITGNTAKAAGGGIYNDQGTLTINGGTITGNKGTSSDFSGGGIYNNAGILIIKNGTITENTAEQYGGGIYNDQGTLTINGGTITGNKAHGCGGGICESEGTTTINSGTITENTTDLYGGGIYCYGTLTLGGDAVVTGNTSTKTGTEDSIYLESGKTITISGETPLEEGAAFGVSLKTGTGTFATGAKESDQAYFTLDGDPNDKDIAYDSDNQSLIVKLHEPVTIEVQDETDLNTALSKVKKGDTIQLTADINLTKTMTVASGKDFTFDLAGFTLARPSEAAADFSVITNNGTLTITDSSEGGTGEITGGTGTKDGSIYFGGGIYNKGTLTINGGTITGNEVANEGGGIYNAINDAKITMNGGTITGNKANGSGGGICNNKGTLTVNSGTITKNSANSGGGILNGSTLILNGGTITENTATKEGGGIHNSGTLTVNSGTITGNEAGTNGGGVYNVVTLTLGGDAVITGNTANSKENNVYLKIDSTTAVSETTPLEGGASFGVSMNGTGTIATNAKESDQAYFTLDGDPADKTITYDAVNQTLNAVNIWKVESEGDASTQGTLNYALDKAGKGDVIQLTNNIDLTASMTITGGKDFTFDLAGFTLARSSEAAADFSVITINENGTLTITDSSEDGTGTITGGTGKKTGSYTDGGGIFNEGILTINGGTITGNTASTGGGISSYCALIVNGGTITGNSAKDGGGILNNAELVINAGTITENSATSSGGGIYHSGDLLILGGDADITGNTVNSEENNVYLPSEKTITISEETPLEKGAAFGVTLQDGKGTFAAGAKESDQAYFTLDGDPADKAITYDAVNQTLNAVQVWTITSEADDSATGTLRKAIEDAADGDIIQFADNVKTITLSKVLFINKAMTINGGSGGNFVTLDGNSKCQVMSIGVQSANGVKINNVKFVNGAADQAGALSITGTNTNYVSSVVLTNCVFQNNKADNNSGAVRVSYCSSLELNNCLITGNSAYGEYSKGGAFYISNCTAAEFNNCTITNNSANSEGNALFLQQSTVTLNNSIVVNNTGCSTEIKLGNGSGTFIFNNVLGAVIDWSAGITKNNCINYDSSKQLFVSTAAGSEDYHIVDGSQAQDAGDSTLVPETLTTDLDGNPRISGDAVDLGCYEITAVAVTNTNDVESGEEGYEGSLRWALEQDNDKIVFDKSLSGKTITLTSQLNISKDVTIDASSLENGITISGDEKVRIFEIGQDGNPKGTPKVELIGLTLTKGKTSGGINIGGAIFAHGGAVITLTNCVLTKNWAQESGAAINCMASCTLTMTNCVVTDNYAVSGPSAIMTGMMVTVTMTNCTIAGNSSVQDRASLYLGGYTSATLNNCILVKDGTADAVAGGGTAAAHNTLSTYTGWNNASEEGNGNLVYDPEKALFADSGDYHLAKDSQAKDVGKNDYSTEKIDLDGYKRVMYDTIDMGAYEYQYTITACDCTFDGQEHAAFTIETLEAGATASCTVDGTPAEGIPSYRAAGSHNLVVTIKRDGYKDYVWKGTSNIERAAVTISNVDAQNKDYDAKTAAEVEYTQSGLIKGTNAELSYTANFENKNAGDNKTVNIKFEITGQDRSNYKIVVDGKSYTPEEGKPYIVTTTDTANISKAELTVIGTTVSGKTYDKTTSVAVSDIKAGTLDGVQENESQKSDDVSIDTVSGTYDNANAGDRTVTVSYTLKGDDADNYTVRDSEHTDITISQRKLTVDGTTVDNKYYDGTTDATVNCGTLNLSNIVLGDDATIKSYTGTFADQWPGKNKDVTVKYTLDNANYCVADETKKADITLSLEVTTLEDVVSLEDDVISLREAITYANTVAAQGGELKTLAEGMTITFADTLFTEEAPKGTITLTEDLTSITAAYDIDGANRVTIDGAGTYSIIKVAGGSGMGSGTIGSLTNPVTITGLTLTGGNGTNGSAVNVTFSFVTLKNSILADNSADQNGGAIYTFSSTIAVTNSTINGNTASSGGAIYFSTSSTATLVNNTIVGNTATTGAALYASAGTTITTYNNLIVSNGTGTAADQLSGVTLTENGCNYMTMDASSVFKTALPKTSAGYLTWIPALKGNKSVVNKGSMSDTVKDAFGVDKTETDPEIAWSGIKDNYGNDRVTITSNPAANIIDIGSYEIDQLETPENFATSADENTITATWDAVEDADNYTLEYQRYDAGAEVWTTVTGLKETSYTITGLEYGMKYNIRVKAVDSTGTFLDSEYAVTSEVTYLDEWNLSYYPGTTIFTIDTYTSGDDLHLALRNGSGEILRDNFVKTGYDLTVIGSDTAIELTFGSGAMKKLGLITYTGNGDTVLVEGTPEIDIFTIDRETVHTIDKKDIPNPYETAQKSLYNLYESGIISKTMYDLHKANYDKAYEEYQTAVYNKSAVIYETVALNEGIKGETGAKMKLTGVRQISIDAKESDDVLVFNQLGTDYNIIAGDGEDKLDFSAMESRLILNMGVSFKQYAAAGQLGSLTLHGDVEQVIGTKLNDEITSASNTTYINGNGGADKLVLISDAKTNIAVDLSGGMQKVTAAGDGIYQINLAGGTGSVINAAAVSSKGALNLTASGDSLFISGTAGADKIDVTGNYAHINGNNGDDTIVVTGSNASISGGFGNDTIIVKKAEGQSSDKNTVYGDAGDDFINLRDTDGKNTVYGGSGNDILIGGAGADTLFAQSGRNLLIGYGGADNLSGGTGRDLLIANTTKLMEEQIGKEAEKDQFYRTLGAQWIADGDFSGITALIGEESIADSAVDKLLSGQGGKNVMYANGTTDSDFISAASSDKVFSDLKDPV